MELPHKNGVKEGAPKHERSRSSSSSSSFSSSEKDFFQLDLAELNQLAAPDDDDSSNVPSAGGHTTALTQSPPSQVMEMPSEPDPYRIPASVFARTTTATPLEWSVASNESLFSIHVGNNSFSRDQLLLGQMTNLPSPSIPFSPSPLGARSPLGGERSEIAKTSVDTEDANAETMKEVLKAAANEQAKTESQPGQGINLSPRSDGSSSVKSFAFPILAEGSMPRQQKQKDQEQSPHQAPLSPSQPSLQKKPQQNAPEAAPSEGFPCFSCFSCCSS